ncbi:hypothetical protein Q8F55_006051 [Vanrija albida]|uniref:Uncharacterized protein n=1 Tax=Vanrija albida TaxID=181172 RepID=A0ABR3Q4C2_9TREE
MPRPAPRQFDKPQRCTRSYHLRVQAHPRWMLVFMMEFQQRAEYDCCVGTDECQVKECYGVRVGLAPAPTVEPFVIPFCRAHFIMMDYDPRTEAEGEYSERIMTKLCWLSEVVALVQTYI